MENPANPGLHVTKKLWHDPTIELIGINTGNGQKSILTANEGTLSGIVGSHGHRAGNPGDTFTISYVAS